METADLDSLMYGMIATYLCTVAIQGFQEETDSAWRRGFGGFGSLIAIFMLSTTINDPLYEAVTWLGLGIVAFGFGMMYMQRFGEDGDVYVGEQMVEAPATLIPPPITEEESIPEPVTKSSVEEDLEKLSLIETNQGFFFKLSPDILKNVKQALENTNYEGFKPVLEFDASGQIVLNFE